MDKFLEDMRLAFARNHVVTKNGYDMIVVFGESEIADHSPERQQYLESLIEKGYRWCSFMNGTEGIIFTKVH